MTGETPPLLPRQTYREGQLLGVDAFEREQALHIGLREYQTRKLFTPGVLAGLEVTAAPAAAPAVGWVVTIAPGAAFDAAGRLILLVDQLRFDGRDIQSAGGNATIAIGDARFYPVGPPTTWWLAIASGEAEGTDRRSPQPLVSLLAQAPGPDLVSLAQLIVTATAATSNGQQTSPPVITVSVAGTGARATLDPGRLPRIDGASVEGSIPADKVAGVAAERILGLIAPEQLQPVPPDKLTGWAALVARVEALEARFPAIPDAGPARRPLQGYLLNGTTFLGTRIDMAMLTNAGFTVQALVRPARLQGELPLMSAIFSLIDSPAVRASVLPETQASLVLSLLDGQPHLRFMAHQGSGFAPRTVTGRHTLLPGLWALISLTLDADGSATLYVDGVETGALPAGGGAVLADLMLLATDGTRLFRGEAAWFALWNGARSGERIAATPDRFLTVSEVAAAQAEGMAGYWPLARRQEDDVQNRADAAAGARLAPSWKMPSAWAETARPAGPGGGEATPA